MISSVGGIILHYIGMKYAADGDTLEILVAVLNSNFWLSIHVTTITFGYGVSIIAGLMAHAYLFQSIINPQPFWKKNEQAPASRWQDSMPGRGA